MTKLRKVDVEEVDENSDVSKIFVSLSALENLECLILRGFRFRSMPFLDELCVLNSLTKLKLDGLLPRLPSCDSFPPNICCLTLLNSSLEEDPMPVLEKLPNLIYLKLRNAFTGQEMMISHDGLPVLQELCIGELWHLRNVQVEEGALLKLRVLEINNCPYLENVPEAMLANLSELKTRTTRDIASKLHDLDLISKIRHVDIHP